MSVYDLQLIHCCPERVILYERSLGDEKQFSRLSRAWVILYERSLGTRNNFQGCLSMSNIVWEVIGDEKQFSRLSRAWVILYERSLGTRNNFPGCLSMSNIYERSLGTRNNFQGCLSMSNIVWEVTGDEKQFSGLSEHEQYCMRGHWGRETILKVVWAWLILYERSLGTRNNFQGCLSMSNIVWEVTGDEKQFSGLSEHEQYCMRGHWGRETIFRVVWAWVILYERSLGTRNNFQGCLSMSSCWANLSLTHQLPSRSFLVPNVLYYNIIFW